jgi:phosphoribosylpyrophosphate synthetase
MGTRVARLAAVERGELERRVFADGDRYLRLKTEVEGCGTVALGGTISDSPSPSPSRTSAMAPWSARCGRTSSSLRRRGRGCCRAFRCPDLIRSGSSLINAARAYREAGARSVAAVATHGVFPGDALERIEQSGLIEKVIVTDSHPRAVALAGSFLEVVTVAPIFAGYLKENPCSS